MDGKGTFSWGDGRSYTGDYKNDQKHGYGIYIWPDGRRFEGMWQDGKQNGEGKFISKDGSIKEGCWKNGKLDKWATQSRQSKSQRFSQMTISQS